MMSAKDIALAAAQAELADKTKEEQKTVDDRNARNAAYLAYGQRLLEDSPLSKWFPDETWQWADTPFVDDSGQSRYVVTPNDQSFYLMLTRSNSSMGGEHYHSIDPDNVEHRPVSVYWAVREYDQTYYMQYWNNWLVRNPADIGKHLLKS